jgi:tRNA nucleotidyltransferase (CCA-adding enzyme)
MAVQLNGGRAGRLIDCYGGGDDLRTRTIRVLHEKSFLDDPTRIFRAIRFEQRFNGRMEPQTSRLLVEAAATDLIDRLSGPRLRQEWFLLFAERDPLRAMDRVNSLKLMRFLHPELRYGGLVRRVLRTLPGAIAWWEKRYPSCVIDRSVLYLMGLLIASDDSVVKGVLGRLMLSREQARRLRFTGLLLASVAGRLAERKNIPSSQLYRLLDPLPDEALVLSLAEVVAKSNRSKSGRARRRLTRFIGRLRGIKLSLRGNDLLRLGMKPGPQMTELLSRLRDARLDGIVRTRADEQTLVRAWLNA